MGCSGKTDIPDGSKRPRGGHGQELGNPGAVFSFPGWETPLEVQFHDAHEHSRCFGTCPETWQDHPGWPSKSSLSQLSLTSICRPPPLSSPLLLFHAQNSCSRWTQLASVWDVSQHLVMCSWISEPLCGVSHWLWLDPCRTWAPSSWVHKPKSIIWKQTPRSLRQGPEGTALHWDTASWPCPPRILFFLLFLLHWLFLKFPFSRDGDKSTIPLGLFSLPAPFLYLTFVKTFLHLGYETEHSWECCQSRNIAVPSKKVNFLFSSLGEEVNWWDGEMGGKGGIVFWLRVCQDSKPGTVTS